MAGSNGTGPATAAPPDTALQPGEWARVLTLGLPALRKLRGWSQADLARRSGLHRRTVWRLEQPVDGFPVPTHQTITALARACGYGQLSDFWAALQGTVATDPGTPLVVGARLRRMVQAFMDCTPDQQQIIEGIILLWSAYQRADARGQAHALDLDVVLRREPNRRPTGVKEHNHDRRTADRQHFGPRTTPDDS